MVFILYTVKEIKRKKNAWQHRVPLMEIMVKERFFKKWSMTGRSNCQTKTVKLRLLITLFFLKYFFKTYFTGIVWTIIVKHSL